ncbi:MAG: histidine kinase [Microbacteriaceae bacterium]
MDPNDLPSPTVLVGIAIALAVVALALLVLWLLARSRVRTAERDRTAAERDRLEAELALGEVAGRLRIMRELHDVAAASVSALAAQAESVKYSTADPDATRRGLEQLAPAAQSALADLRRASSLARDGEAQAGSIAEPALSTLDELFDLMRESGLGVEVDQTGSPFELRDGAELAVYRVLQRGLDNALRHGGDGTTARVALRWSDNGLQVLIDDDGTRAAARREGLDPDRAAQQRPYSQEDDLAALTRVASGRGLTEMRERTENFGGVFTTHEVPGVGFSVSAIFPALAHHNGIHGVKLSGE